MRAVVHVSAATMSLSTSIFAPPTAHLAAKQSSPLFTQTTSNIRKLSTRRLGSFTVQAAKVPAGVVVPKVQPKFQAPFLGFTRTAEVWNSRACMIGLIGTFIVELILNKGILEMIGVEIGKGLDIPL